MVTPFVKEQSKDLQYAGLVPSSYFLEYIPLIGSIFALNALIRTPFSSDSYSSDLWSRFKNLCRHLVALIPCGGLVLLMIDAVRLNAFYALKIEDSLNGSYAGIAVDNQVVFTLSLDKFDELFPEMKPERRAIIMVQLQKQILQVFADNNKPVDWNRLNCLEKPLFK